MLTRILLAGACLFATMVAIKDGRVLRTSGITARCTVVQRNTEGSELAACRSGKLEGRPDLRRRGCLDAGTLGRYQYWRCPAVQATH